MRKRTAFGVVCVCVMVAGSTAVADDYEVGGGTAKASDYVDSRLTFVFADDNLLAGPGETLLNSPSPDFGPRIGNFFPFENLDTRDSGEETLSSLVLYGRFPGFNDRLLTEAALVIRTQFVGDANVAFSDDGSWIGLTWALGNQTVRNEDGEGQLFEAPDHNISITAFPFSSDRFRLGYMYDLSWGDRLIFTELRDRPVPAVRVQYNNGLSYIYGGAKTTRQLQALKDPEEIGNNELQAFWGFLGGFGIELGSIGLWEVNGGFFQSGTNRKPDVVGEPINSFGVNTRLSFFDGLMPGTSIDFRLYENSLEFSEAFLRNAPHYSEHFEWLVSVEANFMGQLLGDPDTVGGTETQPAFAGGLNFDTSFGHFDTAVDLLTRSLSFVLFNVPSLDPMNAFPKDSEQTPEVLAALTVQYHIESLNLTPGILLGMTLPASYRGQLPTLPNPPDNLEGEQTVVVRNAFSIEPLPQGSTVLPIYAAKVTLRLDLSDMLSILTQVQYSRDPNQTRLVDNEFGYATRVFTDPDILGFSILTQARF